MVRLASETIPARLAPRINKYVLATHVHHPGTQMCSNTSVDPTLHCTPNLITDELDGSEDVVYIIPYSQFFNYGRVSGIGYCCTTPSTPNETSIFTLLILEKQGINQQVFLITKIIEVIDTTQMCDIAQLNILTANLAIGIADANLRAGMDINYSEHHRQAGVALSVNTTLSVNGLRSSHSSNFNGAQLLHFTRICIGKLSSRLGRYHYNDIYPSTLETKHSRGEFALA